jgi:hypothetical protein
MKNRMTVKQATEWVYSQDESDDQHDNPTWQSELDVAFGALYGRAADDSDREAGLWSLCCAVTPNCGTRPERTREELQRYSDEIGQAGDGDLSGKIESLIGGDESLRREVELALDQIDADCQKHMENPEL